ncbi:hypothetical protein RHSIM_Rhsim05G0124700 [Rhododendron simsii]|uniref:Uncharacterized protein n=1 Tax=Rhododendron simsii TaxID=118357 RepID=A0A834GVB4_RHOSS|nr:hypothetical protein RHSIM_Rhsim05G0124700 [Rhododendron simsii]
MAQFSDLDHAFESISAREVSISPTLERISTDHFSGLKEKKLLALLVTVIFEIRPRPIIVIGWTRFEGLTFQTVLTKNLMLFILFQKNMIGSKIWLT